MIGIAAALFVLASLLLSGVNAGDPNGGGHGIITALFP